MLVKPILASTKVIDAKTKNSISFVVIGGEQFYGFVYEIYDNKTSALIKTESVISQLPSINISANVLTNGVEYKLRIKTHNLSMVYSEFSDYMILKCYANATVSINNFTIENEVYKIKNQKYIFEGQYTQTENVALKCFRYILYSHDGTLIKEYPAVYQQSNPLNQYIDGLDNYQYYKLELICTDQNDINTSSGIYSFYVEYVSPKIRQVVSLTNDPSTASIIIESDARQLIFTPSGNVRFINNEKIDVSELNSYVYMSDACTITADFTLQIWQDRCFVDKEFLVMKYNESSNDKIMVSYCNDNRFHVRKNIGTIVMEYISDEIQLNNKPFTVFIQQISQRIDVLAEVLA